MYRAKESLLPIQYYNRLPKNEHCDVAYVVDPCIATANTIHAVVSILKKWGAKKVVVVAAIGAKEGESSVAVLGAVGVDKRWQCLCCRSSLCFALCTLLHRSAASLSHPMIGVDRLQALHPDVEIYIGAVDDKLTAEGMILPGIGDAGDRQFRTPLEVAPCVLPEVGSPLGKRAREEEAAPASASKGKSPGKGKK